nr:hypothetical protein [Tanacetum cinerariifolium]
MGTFRETLAESTEGTPQFGPKRPRVYSDLSSEEKDRYNADIWATNILLQWLPKYIYTLINHYTDAKDIWDNADDCDAFDSDVDEAPTAQTMFMANFSSADPVTDEAGPSYDSDILSEFGPERPRVYSDLSSEEKDWYNADIWATNILLQWLPKYIYTLIKHYTDAKDIWDNVKMLLEGSELAKEDREFAKLINDMRNIKITMSKLHMNSKFVNNMLPEYGRYVTAVKLNRGLRDSNYDQLYAYLKQHETHAKENKMILERFSQPTVDHLALLSHVSNPQHYSPSSSALSSTQVPPPLAESSGNAAGYGGAPNRVGNDNQGQARTAQENKVALDAEQLLFLVGGQDNVFDDDVDEQPAPTAQTMFMANFSSADPVTDEAGPSYDSDILSEVPDYEHYLDVACAHEGHVTHDNIQLDHFVDSHADYTSDSHMIAYDQYVRDNEVLVVHSGASSIPTDAFMMIYNDMYESHDPSISNTSRNIVVKNSLTAELATYKEHVELSAKSEASLETKTS